MASRPRLAKNDASGLFIRVSCKLSGSRSKRKVQEHERLKPGAMLVTESLDAWKHEKSHQQQGPLSKSQGKLEGGQSIPRRREEALRALSHVVTGAMAVSVPGAHCQGIQ